MTGTQMVTRVQALLGQNPSVTTNLVTQTHIIDFLNEAIEVMCLMGKVWVCREIIDLSKTGGVPTKLYAYPTADDITVALAAGGLVRCLSVISVTYVPASGTLATGEALTLMEPNQRGKVHYTDATPQWWYQMGNYIYIIPDIGTGKIYVTFYGHPHLVAADSTTYKWITSTNIATDRPPFGTEYHQYCVIYAAARGKVMERLYDEGLALLTGFSQSLGIQLETLKAMMGLD